MGSVGPGVTGMMVSLGSMGMLVGQAGFVSPEPEEIPIVID